MSKSTSNRVLVVDDEPGIRETLAGVLEDEGYDVESVESGERCLELLAETTVPVVLLDIWLPGIDGLDVLGRIGEMPVLRRPVVVMISGHGNIETAVRATKLGALDFLEKPLSVERVIVAVRNGAGSSQLARAKRGPAGAGQRRVPDPGRQRANEGTAKSDQADGPDKRTSSDLRGEWQRQGTGGPCDPCLEPASRRPVR